MYKVALRNDVRGISEHRLLRQAKAAKKKAGSEYKIYKNSKTEDDWDLVG